LRRSLSPVKPGRLSRSQRRSIGAALLAVGAVTTIPAAMAVFGNRSGEPLLPPADYDR